MPATTSLPTSFAFAFALTLIRSKPHRVAIEDYILALRKSALPALNGSVAGSTLINHSELWQQLFNLTQQSNLCLRGTTADFNGERENNKDDEPIGKLVERKRKFRSGPGVRSQANNRLKRRKLSLSSDAATAEHHNDGTLILQVTSQLNRIVREPVSNLTDFTGAISTACDVVLRICDNAQATSVADRSGRSQVSTLNEACQAAGQIWTAIISSLEALNDKSRARSRLGPLAVPMSSIIRSFLGRLRLHCLEETWRRCTNSSDISPLKCTDGKKRLGNENDAEQMELFLHNSNEITRSLTYLLSTAARLYTEHREIYNAIASVFLQHVGESMALQLFGGSGNSGALGYALLPGLSSSSGSGISRAKSAAQIEAPYLVKILRPFVQTILPERRGCTSSNLIENLQKALLQGIFGNEDEQIQPCANSVETVDTNRANGTDLQVACDENDEDWFLSQVWEILGWDVLIC